MAKTTAKKKPTPAEAKRDRVFAVRQAFEITKMLRAQQRVRDLSRSLERAARSADVARVSAAHTLIDETTFAIVDEGWRLQITKRLSDATTRVAELEQQLANLERDREAVHA